MRRSFAVSFLALSGLLAARALASCGSSNAASEAVSNDAGLPDVSFDVPVVNQCLVYGPAGASCKTGGVCGEGEVNDTSFLCLSSIEICCVPASALGVDAGVQPLPDGSFLVMPDSGGPHDAGPKGHDSGVPKADGGHDGGLPRDAGQDTGHSTDHDSGHDAHEATHDAGMDATKPADADHHDAKNG
jgi:hypothetical protein